MEKTNEHREKGRKTIKGICKNSVTPSKVQAHELRPSKKKKRCKPKA
jgi:hypothetical protein